MLTFVVLKDDKYPAAPIVKISLDDSPYSGAVALGVLDKSDRASLITDLEQAIKELSYDFEEQDE